ncbi:hypothetical protein ACH4JZ_18525 [Streptomyces sp. NPDC017615]|uniref:hypothetical protein n=1 Tax=Streptomyces sp. NPDC017615 TaxID=3365003 RepID=UPI0037AE61B3
MTRGSMQLLLFVAIFASGIAAGCLGMLTGRTQVGWVGLFVAGCGVPLLICRSIKTSMAVRTDELAEARNAGYKMALQHVSLGLLDQHTVPPEGPGTTAPNVVLLRPVRSHEKRSERMAQ